MSSMYYIGTIKGDIINKPIETSGTVANCVEELLKYCNIDIYHDFNYFRDDNAWLLFYKLTKEDRELINIPFIDDTGCKTEIDYEEFPVVCDGKVLDNGNSYHLNRVKPIDYSDFKCLNTLNYDILDKMLKDKSFWKNNKKSDFFVKEIIDIYETISEWILNNKNIYWW